MKAMRNGLVIAWHWFWLRFWVLLWCIQHGRVLQFNTAVAHIEERKRQEIRQLVWELRREGKIRGEVDADGELRLYAVEDDD